MPLPEYFCWTRFGTEAGQSVEQILARKEQERSANGGVFFWGIGNALGPSMIELLRRTDTPEAVFSPIRSAPRREDAMPSSVVAWTKAQTLSGEEYRLPAHSLITSRLDPLKPRTRHYALVCHSGSPIGIEVPSEQIQFSNLRNLLTSRPVGASQVTAVVELNPRRSCEKAATYEVAFRVQLTPPYFVLLREPVSVGHVDEDCCWAKIVGRAWDQKRGYVASARVPEAI